MKILGIETSCDETALSIVECKGDLGEPQFTVIDSALNSQATLHAPYGGVFPTLAKREHQKNLPILLAQLMEKHDTQEIEAIAVTAGPGLEPALWVGIEFAKALGEKWNIPVIPTNHMEGHIVSVLLDGGKVVFPAIALLISGGHTQLIKVNAWASYEILGETVDDAVGEAFDKVARILGLPYPGGPEISKLATEARKAELPTGTFVLPRPMLHSGNLNFSFSGLKTAVLYMVREIPVLTDSIKTVVAREFEDAVTEVLVAKTKAALEEAHAETLIVGGGVISNTHIRESLQELCKEEHISLFLPSHEASTDNALMIAAAGYIQFLLHKPEDKDFRADGNLPLGA